MQAAIIAPVKHLREYCITDYHLVIANMVRNRDYVDFYRERHACDDFIILDNGVVETGEPLPIVDLLQAAEIVHANEIVLPDVFCDYKETVQLAQRSLREVRKVQRGRRHLSVMAVPQGKTAEEWFDCLWELLKYDEITTIGIPKVTTKLFKDGRVGCVEALLKMELFDASRNYHLLGVWEDPFEVSELSKHKWIRGVDSRLPVLCGMNGILLTSSDFKKPSSPGGLEYFEAVDQNPAITFFNVAMFIGFAKGNWNLRRGDNAALDRNCTE